jgi:beta-phosphoglucomutase family hydrolase
MTARCGLPAGIEACLFDVDGVLTDTRSLHISAWQRTFDDVLRRRAANCGVAFVPFDPVADYSTFVDGKLRYDGVRSFLASRGITLPDGDPADLPTADTVCGIGNRKNEVVLEHLHAAGVAPLPGAGAYVRAVRVDGLRTAAVSSSENCREMLAAAGLSQLFDVRVDAAVAEREHLRGKPAPDTFEAAARKLRVPPAHAAVFEDALAGVEAGCAGRFGFVVGIAPPGRAASFRQHGADVVVADLESLLTAA